jgi:hypothetical protein
MIHWLTSRLSYCSMLLLLSLNGKCQLIFYLVHNSRLYYNKKWTYNVIVQRKSNIHNSLSAINFIISNFLLLLFCPQWWYAKTSNNNTPHSRAPQELQLERQLQNLASNRRLWGVLRSSNVARVVGIGEGVIPTSYIICGRVKLLWASFYLFIEIRRTNYLFKVIFMCASAVTLPAHALICTGGLVRWLIFSET